MTISIEQLRTLADAAQVHYFLDPRQEALLFKVRGSGVPHQLLTLIAQQGRFLQMRSVHFMHCPAGHPHLAAVHRVLAEINFNLRLAKHCWFRDSGEIVAMADFWVMDTTATPAQFLRMLECLVGAMDESHRRLSSVLATGTDPGSADDTPAPAQAGVTTI